METITLNAQKRDKSMKTSELREEKWIPAEFYGAGNDNVSVQVAYEEFRKTYNKAGKNSVIDLKIKDGATIKVLIQDVQFHPVRDTILHADLLGINLKEKITTHIPLTFVGESAAVKTYGAIFVTHLDEIEVKCLPSDLVSEIEVDISVLKETGETIKLEDLKIPSGMEVLTEPGSAIAQAQAPKEESEEPVSTALVPEEEENKSESEEE